MYTTRSPKARKRTFNRCCSILPKLTQDIQLGTPPRTPLQPMNTGINSIATSNINKILQCLTGNQTLSNFTPTNMSCEMKLEISTTDLITTLVLCGLTTRIEGGFLVWMTHICEQDISNNTHNRIVISQLLVIL